MQEEGFFFFFPTKWLYNFPLEFYYSNQSTLHWGYVYSLLCNQFSLLYHSFQNRQPLLPLFSLNTWQEAKDYSSFKWWNQDWRRLWVFYVKRDRGEKSPNLLSLTKLYGCSIFFFFLILATSHFSLGQWLLVENSKSIFAQGKKIWSECQNTIGTCKDIGLLFIVAIFILRWNSCQFKIAALKQSPLAL